MGSMLTNVRSNVVLTTRVLCTFSRDILWTLTRRSLVKILGLREFAGSLLDVAALLRWNCPTSHSRSILCFRIKNAISVTDSLETYRQLILGICWSHFGRCQTHLLLFVSFKPLATGLIAYLRCCHHQQSFLQSQCHLARRTCVHDC
jgi:hypothetical protein